MSLAILWVIWAFKIKLSLCPSRGMNPLYSSFGDVRLSFECSYLNKVNFHLLSQFVLKVYLADFHYLYGYQLETVPRQSRLCRKSAKRVLKGVKRSQMVQPHSDHGAHPPVILYGATTTVHFPFSIKTSRIPLTSSRSPSRRSALFPSRWKSFRYPSSYFEDELNFNRPTACCKRAIRIFQTLQNVQRRADPIRCHTSREPCLHRWFRHRS